MPVPIHPKIYHIVNVDRLASIVSDGHLWCDAEMAERPETGTIIGMNDIKMRRLHELQLISHPGLFVGQCTPFYFCPRSVMLYSIYARDENLLYQGGQEPIVHLEADFYATVAWANQNDRRWAFTLSNAGSYYFEDRSDITCLDEINWDAVQASWWSGSGVSPSMKQGKMAEFLIERSFPWHLIERIGVLSISTEIMTQQELTGALHRPQIEIKPDWYYPERECR